MNPSLEWTIENLRSLSNIGYTGKIELNSNLGGITNLKLTQDIKPMTNIRINVIGYEVVPQNT